MKNEIELKVFIGCHATYNDGFLFDKQFICVDVDDFDDSIEKAEKHFLDSIKAVKPEWVKDGYITDTYCEELYAADHELYVNGEFVKLDCGECLSELRKFLEIIDGTDFSYPIALLIEVAKNRGDSLENLKDIDQDLFCFQVDSESNSDLAHGYTDMCGTFDNIEGNEFLKQYFDYESYGIDLSQEFTVYDINNTYYAVSDR